MSRRNSLIPVVVTTEHRGVFFGYVQKSQDLTAERVVLSDARMCVSWTSAIRGVVGLAERGPQSGCRIGPKAPKIGIRKVTAIMQASEDAAKAWEEAKWGT